VQIRGNAKRSVKGRNGKQMRRERKKVTMSVAARRKNPKGRKNQRHAFAGQSAKGAESSFLYSRKARLHQREKEGEEGIDEDRHSAMMVQQQGTGTRPRIKF
jgi:hypothetical protein